MAVAANLLTSNFNATDLASYTTASVAPTADRLVLACIWADCATANSPAVDSLSGAGMTWDLLGAQEQTEGGTDDERLTVFRSQSSSPSSGALTIDFGADTQRVVAWTIVEFSGCKSGDNGVQAIRQSKFSFSNPSVTNPSVTFDTTPLTTSGTFGVIANSSGTKPITPGGSFGEVSDVANSTGGAITLESEFANTGISTVNWTISAAGDCSIYACVEIAVPVQTLFASRRRTVTR